MAQAIKIGGQSSTNGLLSFSEGQTLTPEQREQLAENWPEAVEQSLGVFFKDFSGEPDSSDNSLGLSTDGRDFISSGSDTSTLRILNGGATVIEGASGNSYNYFAGDDGLPEGVESMGVATSFISRAGSPSSASGTTMILTNRPRGLSHMVHINLGAEGYRFELWPADPASAEGRILLSRGTGGTPLADGEIGLFEIVFLGNNKIEFRCPTQWGSINEVDGNGTAQIEGTTMVLAHPTLDSYRGQKHPCFQIIQTPNPVRSSFVNWVYAASARETGAIELGRLIGENKKGGGGQGANLFLPDLEVTDAANNSNLPTTARLVAHNVDMEGVVFYLLNLPPLSALEDGETFSIYDAHGSMNPSNPNDRFVQLNPRSGDSIANGSDATNHRFQGGGLTTLRRRDDSTWEVITP